MRAHYALTNSGLRPGARSIIRIFREVANSIVPKTRYTDLLYSVLIRKLRPIKLPIDPAPSSSSCGPAAIRGPHLPPLNICPPTLAFYPLPFPYSLFPYGALYLHGAACGPHRRGMRRKANPIGSLSRAHTFSSSSVSSFFSSFSPLPLFLKGECLVPSRNTSTMRIFVAVATDCELLRTACRKLHPAFRLLEDSRR